MNIVLLLWIKIAEQEVILGMSAPWQRSAPVAGLSGKRVKSSFDFLLYFIQGPRSPQTDC